MCLLSAMQRGELTFTAALAASYPLVNECGAMGCVAALVQLSSTLGPCRQVRGKRGGTEDVRMSPTMSRSMVAT